MSGTEYRNFFPEVVMRPRAEDVHKAAQVVAQYASDAEDLRVLLAALGISMDEAM